MEDRFTNTRLHSLLVGLLLFIGLVTAAIIYYPGKDGPLVLDDISSISTNPNIRVSPVSQVSFVDAIYSYEHVFNREYDIPYRGLSYLSLALNYYFADSIMQEFKLTNVMLHLITALLVFALCKHLFGLYLNTSVQSDAANSFSKLHLDYLALLVCLVWLLHPLYVSSVLYITQRMTIISGLFTVLVALAYIDYRIKFLEKNEGLGRGLFVLGVFTTLAAFAKENGVLAPLYCLVIELVFFRFAFHSKTGKVQKFIFVSAFVLPVLVVFYYLLSSYLVQIDRPPVTREYTVNERLLTQFRVLWQYVGHLLWPADKGIHFYHDNVAVSSSFFSPFTTLTSLIAWILLFGFSLWALIRRKSFIFVFALLWFLFGHSLESTVLPLEMKFEHRNYVPGIGVLMAAVFGVFLLLNKVLPRPSYSLVIMGLVLLPYLSFHLQQHTSAWTSAEALTEFTYERAPDSARVLILKANAKSREDDLAGMHQYLKRASDARPLDAGYSLTRLAHYCKAEEMLPKSLLNEASDKLVSGVPSVMTFNAFVYLMQQCNHPNNDAFLVEIYKSAGASKYNKLAANGLLMQARVAMNQADERRHLEMLLKARKKSLTAEVRKELVLHGLM